ncbi:MAG TPA: hypothetical protein VG055_25145 [Planctomycetaceae bacterium]|jgi:hypothetical protein|nr:hypothetical protein [Planctomycetaceae bacterium]
MHDSKFWRIVAVSFVVAVLYVGHGLHSGRNDALPSMANSAHAGGVGVVAQRGSMLYTASQDGRTLYQWNPTDTGKPKYIALSNVELSP